jgi:hypothetical protein
VKAIDERVQVLGGALLMGTPHTLPAFWQGAIEAGVYDSLDGVSYHNYSGWPNNNWGAVFEKAQTLRATTDLPLWITETSLLCDDNCGAEFEADQAAYLRYVLNNATDHGIDTVIWFMAGYNGWRQSDLVRADDTPKPVFYEYEKFFMWR